MTKKNESLVKGKSMFYPSRNRNKELQTRITFINKLDISNEKSKKKSNFSPKELTELTLFRMVEGGEEGQKPALPVLPL